MTDRCASTKNILKTFSVVIYAHHLSASRGDNRRLLLYKKEISLTVLGHFTLRLNLNN